MQKFAFNRGRTIFNKGDGGSELFIISSGEVGIYFPSNAEMEKPDLILKSPEIFGEMAVIDDALRMAISKSLLVYCLLMHDFTLKFYSS